MKKTILTLAIAAAAVLSSAQPISRSANPALPPLFCPPICAK
jgi:hypothetical protein